MLWLLRNCLLINYVLMIHCLNYQTNMTAEIHGDFKIGVLVSVHHQPLKLKNKTSRNNMDCGEIREHYGIQRVETIVKTIDEINKDPNLLRNITLGVEIRDSCWYAPIALQQTIELIRESISPLSSKYSSIYKNQQCSNESKPVSVQKESTLIGVLGPASSSIALQVQNLLQLFSIPQIGYSTTSKDLSDKSRFSTFMRVVPSDYYQAQVMIDIVKSQNWSYINTVHTDENYGQSGMQAFRELAEKNDICIAKEDSILSNADERQFQEVLKNLIEDEHANVIVCFCEGMTIRGLLQAMKEMNLTHRFLIIGSDGWADRQEVVTNFEQQALGSISIRIHSPPLASFDDYYFGLNPYNNSRNPWFKEFWETKFNCKMLATKPITTTATTTTTPQPIIDTNDTSNSTVLPSIGVNYCTGHEKLSEKYKQEPKLSFLIKAIFTMAHGLQELQQDVCGKDFVGICPNLRPFNRSIFLNYLMNVSFPYELDVVEFNSEGDPSARYDIMNYQLQPDGSHDYILIGEWNNFSMNFIRNIQHPPTGAVKSVCSKPCLPGYYKIIQEVGSCCWSCLECEDNQYLKNETLCEDCEKGFWPNEDKTECYEIPMEFHHWNDNESLVATFFSLIGISLTCIVLFVFIQYSHTPVVKASSRELCLIVLIGMILSHLSIFSILAHPSVAMCTLTRILPGIAFSMIYGSLFVKTNRIARLLAISKKRFPSKKLKFMSSLAQVILAFMLIIIESIIAITMLFVESPGIVLKFPSEKRSVLVCDTTLIGILAPLSFIFFLIILCTFYAIKTRNVPENFNETKFVGFAIYTTFVIWLAFFPIYYGSELQIITKCLCISLSSIMTLIFMFFPKIYIILFHPEKNIRALFTTSKSIRCHIGGTRHSNISHKTSSSISSTHGPSSEIDSSLNRPLKRSSSCQTSLDQLFIEKINAASSPIKDCMFDCVFKQSSKLIDGPEISTVRIKPAELVRIHNDDNNRFQSLNQNQLKIKNNKIYTKDSLLNSSNHHNSNDLTRLPHKPIRRSKHQRLKKLTDYQNGKAILCVECFELEKHRRVIKKYEFPAPVALDEENQHADEPTALPIFTIDKPPPTFHDQQFNDRRKIAISEESLSECSISEPGNCKLKRITINFK